MNGPRIPERHDHPDLQYCKRIRKELHLHPEPSWQEIWTSARICTELQRYQFELITGPGNYDLSGRTAIPDQTSLEEAHKRALADFTEKDLQPFSSGHTGVVAFRDFGRAKRTVGFRFDIDGLPITESQDPGHVPARENFASTNGCMHACGHDGHMAIGLGLARRLNERPDAVDGRVYLIFQPAEEGGLGGKVFSTLAFVSNLDRFVAVHLGILGVRNLVCGLRFLACREYDIAFEGRAAHASDAPHEGRNALLAAADAVLGLYGISRHGSGVTRMSVGEFAAPNPPSVISDQAQFRLQLRGETDGICDYLETAARSVLEGSAAKHRTTVRICESLRSVQAPCSPGLVAELRNAALRCGIPAGAIADDALAMGSEDAPFLMRKVQEGGGEATYLCLGCPVRGGHHTASFDFDEDLMTWGVDVLWQLLCQWQTPRS